MIYADKEHCFDELCLNGRTSYSHNGFIRKNRCAFRNCPYIALEFKIFQICEELLAENTLAAEKFNIIIIEFKVIHIVDSLVKTCHDSKAAVLGDISEEKIKV